MFLESPLQRFLYVYRKQSNSNPKQSEKYPENIGVSKKEKVTVILPGDLKELKKTANRKCSSKWLFSKFKKISRKTSVVAYPSGFF